MGLLLLTFIFGTEVNGQRLTLQIGPFSGQPSELLKVILVVFLAGYLSENRALADGAGHAGRAAPPAAAAVSRPDGRDVGDRPGIVVIQRDLGAALLFFGVFLALLYVATGAGQPGRHRARPVRARQRAHGEPVRPRPDRIDIWLDPFADPLGAGYQVVQALHAFARGGLVGRRSRRRAAEIGGRLPIPEVHTDFPLAALGEELGIVGVLAILGLYLVVVERGLRIGAAAADDFRSLLAVGLALVIGIQAFIIAAGNLKVLPLTGVTLPFISYGGSSLLANALVVGLLLALSDKGVEPPPVPRVRVALASPSRGERPDDDRDRAPRAGRSGGPIVHVAVVLSLAFALLAGAAGYWGVVAGARPRDRSPDDAAVIAAARTVPRGLDHRPDGKVLASNKKDANGESYRVYAGARSARSSATRRRATDAPASSARSTRS